MYIDNITPVALKEAEYNVHHLSEQSHAALLNYRRRNNCGINCEKYMSNGAAAAATSLYRV